MRRMLAAFMVLSSLLTAAAFGQQSRHFVFRYAFSVRGIKPGQKVEIWFPQAHTDDFQDVNIVSVTGDLPLKHIYQCAREDWMKLCVRDLAEGDNTGTGWMRPGG